MATADRTAPARASNSTRPGRRAGSLSARVGPILRRAHQGKASLAEIGRAAQELEVPVWVLLVPGVAAAGPEIGRHQAAIQKMVEDYVAEHCVAPALREFHETIGEDVLRGR